MALLLRLEYRSAAGVILRLGHMTGGGHTPPLLGVAVVFLDFFVAELILDLLREGAKIE